MAKANVAKLTAAQKAELKQAQQKALTATKLSALNQQRAATQALVFAQNRAGSVLDIGQAAAAGGKFVDTSATPGYQGAATTGAFRYSDYRLKENIKTVGRDKRTMLPLYEFEYIGGSGKRYLGVMADDVKVRYPEMVVTMPDGYDAVNYAGLGIEMLEV